MLLQPSWLGMAVLVFGLLLLVTGILGAELFLARVSLLFSLAGLSVLFLGWNYLRAALFPLLFLLLMIPIPSIIFGEITFPLQALASSIAAHVLPWFGVPIFREGNILNLPSMALEVAEACSGIRSLLSLTAIAVMYGYISRSRTWVRVTLGLASIPIAVLANSLRIVGTGVLVQYWNPDKAKGFFHLFSGWLMFVFSLGALLLIDFALSRFRRRERT